MKLGIIGLGRMGNAIAQRVIDASHQVIGFDQSPLCCAQAEKLGVTIVGSTEEVAQKARIIWLMVPAGEIVDSVLALMRPHLQKNDIIIDGGNSNFKDTIRRAKELEQHDIYFLDCGTSGGIHGRETGFSLMVGGDEASYIKIHSLLEAIAAPGGVGLVGPSGAGHYVKMVHNGIEYGLLQAYAEGFHLIKEGSFKKYNPDLEQISRIWSNGAVIRSWILDLAHTIFEQDQEFHTISGQIGQSGTGKWCVENADENKIPVPAMQAALKVRTQSEQTDGNYATKIVALLRHAFGGHPLGNKKQTKQ
ncbi:MAG: decarboxylating 6-phosphogluconate dehydrogenase [Candidatus Dependentiae bacterium]|nr:decarboxylating 6-phosphogluconate dehydrogenase [Candidatus Dependentiae bacterium]